METKAGEVVSEQALLVQEVMVTIVVAAVGVVVSAAELERKTVSEDGTSTTVLSAASVVV